MTAYADLKVGGKYRVARVDKRLYVVIEGFEQDAAGGIYWTEFSLIDPIGQPGAAE